MLTFAAAKFVLNSKIF